MGHKSHWITGSVLLATVIYASSFPSPDVQLNQYHRWNGVKKARSRAKMMHSLENGKAPKLSLDNLNEKIVNVEYAVRGKVLEASFGIEKRIQQGEKVGLGYKNLCMLNIGNPHVVGNTPISFYRQVLSVCIAPELLEKPNLYPKDVYDKAKRYLDPKNMPGGTGSYTQSMGMTAVRQDVAAYIEDRDGCPANPDRIILSNGASAAICMVLNTILREPAEGFKDGCLTPVPQYPLYSATLTALGAEFVPYYLDESKGWSITVESLKRSVEEARKNNIVVRAIVVINPGNPTGQVLKRDDIENILQYAAEENLVVLADEVYQANIWREDRPFHSFKKVACDLGLDVNLASFHSTSKGFIGECGMRGGYVELHGFCDDFMAVIKKFASVSLCSNTSGQIMMGLMTNSPKESDESYPQFAEERDRLLASLKRRAHMICDVLNTMQGVSCLEPEGAMYAFPRIHIPQGGIDAAKAAGQTPDEFYCLYQLEQSGVIMVPGSGFSQEPGTYHFRIAILALEENLPDVLERLKKSHELFLRKYS